MITELSDLTVDCGMKYRLLVKDPSAAPGVNEYRLWDDFRHDL
jgi:hypothetical protein